MIGRRNAFLLKSICILLQYPDEMLLSCLQQLKADIVRQCRDADTQVLLDFIDDLQGRPLLDLQERYTALFDLNPAATLNLACHLPGEAPQKARCMSELQALYAAAGYDAISGELPDYLPLILEFLTLAPDCLRQPPIGEVLSALPVLIENLQSADGRYASLLNTLFTDEAENQQTSMNAPVCRAKGEKPHANL